MADYEDLTIVHRSDKVERYVCPTCEIVFIDPDDPPGPAYECGNCDNTWHREEEETHRCPECGKFATKVADHCCPLCYEPVEKEVVYELDNGGTIISLLEL